MALPKNRHESSRGSPSYVSKLHRSASKQQFPQEGKAGFDPTSGGTNFPRALGFDITPSRGEHQPRSRHVVPDELSKLKGLFNTVDSAQHCCVAFFKLQNHLRNVSCGDLMFWYHVQPKTSQGPCPLQGEQYRTVPKNVEIPFFVFWFPVLALTSHLLVDRKE